MNRTNTARPVRANSPRLPHRTKRASARLPMLIIAFGRPPRYAWSAASMP